MVWCVLLSLPAWGEWIEMTRRHSLVRETSCLYPHGESELGFSIYFSGEEILCLNVIFGENDSRCFRTQNKGD